ncbi:MAG: VOC family protein [Gemmatimonadetes bacterium]|nr:VOC family protein [Gemmatimonadota bacterium]
MSTTDQSTNGTNGTNRAEPESFRARALSASITANNLQKSLAWYCDVVGFTLDQKFENEGKVVAAAIKAGDVTLILNQDDGAKGANRVKGQGLSLNITTAQSIDEVAARIKGAGGKLESEPADMPWGARMFQLIDPDGFKLMVTT